MSELMLETTVTCPWCDARFPATMPMDACVRQLPCPVCGGVLARRAPYCCVFCSHADHRCPPEQADASTIRADPIFQAWSHMRGTMKYDPLRFARHAFDAIAAGDPTTVDAAAEALGISIDEAQQHAEKFEAFGLMDRQGDMIVGSLGLTTQKTQYDLELNGRQLHVWCALDAVGIPAALGVDAHVQVDGLADIDIQGGRLSTAEPQSLRIRLNDPYMEPNMKAQICPTISFHKEAGPEHDSVAWLTVAEAMELGRVIWAPPTPENTRAEEMAA